MDRKHPSALELEKIGALSPISPHEVDSPHNDISTLVNPLTIWLNSVCACEIVGVVDACNSGLPFSPPWAPHTVLQKAALAKTKAFVLSYAECVKPLREIAQKETTVSAITDQLMSLPKESPKSEVMLAIASSPTPTTPSVPRMCTNCAFTFRVLRSTDRKDQSAGMQEVFYG